MIHIELHGDGRNDVTAEGYSTKLIEELAGGAASLLYSMMKPDKKTPEAALALCAAVCRNIHMRMLELIEKGQAGGLRIVNEDGQIVKEERPHQADALKGGVLQ